MAEIRKPLRKNVNPTTAPKPEEAPKEEAPKQPSMIELIKASKKIDENSAKAGIKREPITRPRVIRTPPDLTKKEVN